MYKFRPNRLRHEFFVITFFGYEYEKGERNRSVKKLAM